MRRPFIGCVSIIPTRSFASSTRKLSGTLPKTVRQLLDTTHINKSDEISVYGWIKSVRQQKRVAFAQLSDGTDLDGRGLQVVFENPDLAKRFPFPFYSTFDLNSSFT